MSQKFNDRSRHSLGTAAMTRAAAHFGGLPSAHALGRANSSFGPLKQINAGLVSVGYADACPPNLANDLLELKTGLDPTRSLSRSTTDANVLSMPSPNRLALDGWSNRANESAGVMDCCI